MSQFISIEGTRVKTTRYAVFSHPWVMSGDAFTEAACLECRDDHMPMVVAQFHKSSLHEFLSRIAQHEKAHHVKVAVVKTAA